MRITIRFLGAARNVTGSRYLVEAGGKRLLVDCGMFQERELRERNWKPFPVEPSSVDAVLLTHAHLDHVGYLPRLAGDGFRGPVYATPATAEIAKIVLLDSGHIQEEDARKKQRRHRKQKRRGPYHVRPLYTGKDAEASTHLFSPVKYRTTLQLGGGLEATWHEAGHILGSAMLTLDVEDGGESRRLLFSGDIGRRGKPILRDPTLFDRADYVVMESTYGDRVHEEEESVEDEVARAVNETHERGGNVIIPSFSVERAHEIMYVLNDLLRERRIPRLRVFIDSPMAARVTKVFRHHPELYDEEMTRFVRAGKSPFDFPGLETTMTAEESKRINDVRGGAIVIAGSGMCTGGRVKHHLVHNISGPENTILFTGYQARGTLGREILSGKEEVRILGRRYHVRAEVRQAHGFSGHADREELLRWITALKEPPRRIFVTHGEPDAARAFAKLVREKMKCPVTVPRYTDEAVLD